MPARDRLQMIVLPHFSLRTPLRIASTAFVGIVEVHLDSSKERAVAKAERAREGQCNTGTSATTECVGWDGSSTPRLSDRAGMQGSARLGRRW